MMDAGYALRAALALVCFVVELLILAASKFDWLTPEVAPYAMPVWTVLFVIGWILLVTNWVRGRR